MNTPEMSWDKEANAATIAFTSGYQGSGAKHCPVYDDDGEIAAVLDFSENGELLSIELLDAERQIPEMFRKENGCKAD